jgi:signal transduction histidine kinase
MSLIAARTREWENRRPMNKRIADALAISCAVGALALVVIGAIEAWPSASSMATAALAAAMLVAGSWWLRRRAPQSPFHELALPAASATVLPLLIAATDYRPAAMGVWLLASIVAGALGFRLGDWLEARARPYVTGTGIVLAGLAGTLAIIRLGGRGLDGPGPFEGSTWDVTALAALAAATVLPALAVGLLGSSGGRPAKGRVPGVTALELGVVGITPAIAVLTVALYGATPYGTLPLIAWIVVVLFVQYLAVGPLTQTAATATTQRDLVVAAMEAERSRIAADIHDDALQELTLLAWKLDSTGQGEGAQTARDIADRLRAICGDLRLPILDDLGAGPALEWLVDRVSRLVGGDVRLERGDQVRPPPDVELAFFRVAQEALSNAVRHGESPIVVRYWTSPSGASLSIDDAGRGFEPVRVQTSGHFGVLNMRQRAEQVGALLDIRHWPSGGTQVALEWRAR